MRKTTNLFSSSVGRKFIMAFTGFFLCSFLVVHLSGNFLLFKADGGAAFNAYSDFMSTNMVLRFLEVGLTLGILGHIVYGLWTWIGNRQARPQQYLTNRPAENSSLASRSMFVTGSSIFIFLVVHLNSFFVPTRVLGEHKDMYLLVAEAFKNPLYDAFYVVAIGLLGFHLYHGFQSAFQTFGLRGKKYMPIISFVAFIFWFIIPLGYISMPLYFLWVH